jgi:hypothetical protein
MSVAQKPVLAAFYAENMVVWSKRAAPLVNRGRIGTHFAFSFRGRETDTKLARVRRKETDSQS